MAGDEDGQGRRALSAPVAYDLAIFDLDGTLADSFPFFLVAQNTLARRHGFAEIAPHDVERMRAMPPHAVMRHLGLPRWKFPFVVRGFKQLMRERREPVPLFDGIGEALTALQARGVALAIVTANAGDITRATLGEAHYRRFDHVECGASMFGKARRLRRILRATGVAPRSAIYVGDQVPDGEAARAVGIAFGAVTWGYASCDALAGCTPQQWFETPADLLRIGATGRTA